jgi:hypothetical protein
MFIRFDVTILGGRPWRVKVVGHAAQWDPGAAMPTELRGLAKPSWLGPRSDALQRAIYTRIKQYAVPMVEEQVHTVEDTLPKPDPNAFKSVPAGAAQTLAAIQVALALRDYGKLRPALAANVVWSEGGGTGRDGALAVWQADPGVLTAMAGVLGSCTSDGERVKCPSAPAENGYQLVLELRQQHWQVVSFLRAE